MLEQILEKIQRKGWNMYEIEAVEKAANRDIERGPTRSLDVGKLYVIFPQVADPTSVHQIHEALHKLEVQYPFPHVQYKNRCLPVPYLSFQEKLLIVRGTIDVRIPYELFYQSLDSLNLAPRPN